MGEQRQFDPATVIYFLPLVMLVLQRGGIDRKTQEDVDEQVVLAIEIITAHTEACKC